MTPSTNEDSLLPNPNAIAYEGAAENTLPGNARFRLGPLVSIVPMEHAVISRLYALVILVAAGAILAVAAGLAPDNRHLGTHEQFKLPPCGFVTVTGLPCPTCGMTTAFAYTVRGRFVEAIRSQLAGFLLAIATAATGCIALAGLITGRVPSINWYRIQPTSLLWWITALIIFSWGLKIAIGLLQGTLPAR